MIRIQNDFVPNRSRRVFAGVVTVFSFLGLAYFGVLGLIDPAALVPGADTEAAKTFASYLAPRNLVMGGAAVLLLVLRAWRPLGLLLVLNGVVQALDAVLGLARGDVAQTVGPAVIAVALFAAAAGLREQRTRVLQPV